MQYDCSEGMAGEEWIFHLPLDEVSRGGYVIVRKRHFVSSLRPFTYIVLFYNTDSSAQRVKSSHIIP